MNNKTSPALSNTTVIRYSTLGFSLLEILVSMLIVTFAMLGIAKLQLNAIRDVQSAHYATKAAMLASQMSEQISANKDALHSYQLPFKQTPTLSINCEKAACSNNQLANFDLILWQNNIKKALPSGAGEIITSTSIANIIVRWDEDKSGSTGLNCPKQSSLDMECSKVSRLIL
jgi:type IV pilus assembly protein PilV